MTDIVHAKVAVAEAIDDTPKIAIGQWYWYDKAKDVLGQAGEMAEDEVEVEVEDDDLDEDEDEDDSEDLDEDEGEDEDGSEEEDDPAEDGEDVGRERTFEDVEETPKPPDPPRLACITEIGTNYVELTAAVSERSWRVALGGFDDCCTPEPDPLGYIRRRVNDRQDNVRALMDEIRRVTALIGVTPPTGALEDGDTTVGGSMALAAAHSVGDIQEHKALLIKTQKEILPDLFKKVKDEHEMMAAWMKAELIPMKASLESMKSVSTVIESRIFTVELYAGLVEKMELIRDGAPAPNDTRVALFQRRHYMDEECLVSYKAGGMKFEDIHAFDAWLIRPENAGRILPLARCIVAFRVRRHEKQYEFSGWREFIRFAFGGGAKADMLTFLYLRNGDKIYRMATEINFGSDLFPDKDHSILLGDPGTELWFDPQQPGDVITQARYEVLVEEDRVNREEHAVELAEWEIEHPIYAARDKRYDALYDRWCAMSSDERATFRIAVEQMSPEERDAIGFYGFNDESGPYRALKHPKSKYSSWMSPHCPAGRADEYHRLTTSHVYYDDAMKKIREEAEAHNRIATVIQGILDRSPAFHPHPPWRIFTPEGFAAGIELVYDNDERVLVDGPSIDFEEYRRRITERLRVGDVCYGQDDYWQEKEAEKYNAKESRGRRGRDHYEVRRYSPYGDPGPGEYARPVKVTKTHAVFKWMKPSKRRRVTGYGRYTHRTEYKIEATIKVPLARLFNVSAYTLGDFKMFYNDPRTRASYLQWAPFLLSAEDFAGGKVKVRGDAEEDVDEDAEEAAEEVPEDTAEVEDTDEDGAELEDMSDPDAADDEDDEDNGGAC